MVARWFEPFQHGEEQLEAYFDVIIEAFEKEHERDLFIQACANYFILHKNRKNITITTDDKEAANRLFSELFVCYNDSTDSDKEDIFERIVTNFFAFIEKNETSIFDNLI